VRQRMALAAVPLVGLLLTACGSADAKPQVATAGGQATSSPDQQASNLSAEEKRRKFTQCMKDNGVDMVMAAPGGGLRAGRKDAPAPKSGGNGAAGSARSLEDDPKFKKAIEACRQYEPSGGDLRKPSAEDIAKVREFAKCMREHGVNIPDPPADGGRAVAIDVDPNSSAFKKAEEACRHLAPSGFGAAAARRAG
jgi:hypothetical protein